MGSPAKPHNWSLALPTIALLTLAARFLEEILGELEEA